MDSKQLTERITDFTEEELNSLQNYKDNNLPGLSRIKESDVYQWFDLYMAGKTYSEISKMTNFKKDMILYVSERSNWHDVKMNYFSEISLSLLQKYREVKLNTANGLMDIASTLNKYFKGEFDKYLKSNNPSDIEKIDQKMLSQYLKIVETIDKIILENIDKKDNDKQPTINIHMGPNSKIKQTNNSTVDIEVDGEEEEEAKAILAKLSKIKKTRSSE